jgi:hypothetical protein
MDAQELVQLLQVALGLRVKTGQITLNLNSGRLETFETKTYARLVAKAVDKPDAMRSK